MDSKTSDGVPSPKTTQTAKEKQEHSAVKGRSETYLEVAQKTYDTAVEHIKRYKEQDAGRAEKDDPESLYVPDDTDVLLGTLEANLSYAKSCVDQKRKMLLVHAGYETWLLCHVELREKLALRGIRTRIELIPRHDLGLVVVRLVWPQLHGARKVLDSLEWLEQGTPALGMKRKDWYICVKDEEDHVLKGLSEALEAAA
jgi:hypothetical protein